MVSYWHLKRLCAATTCQADPTHWAGRVDKHATLNIIRDLVIAKCKVWCCYGILSYKRVRLLLF